MVLLGDESQVKARWCTVCTQCIIMLVNYFGHTRWNSSVTWVMWNLASVRLETVLMSVQDRSTVCVKHTIGSKIILDAPDGTPR
jgi:adenine C2-methylase RlmN of 23S rRNA A2503 and tRNA A37